jgi:hypothetical protein
MRYVIKSPAGRYFTGFSVIQSRAITLNGVFVGIENDAVPEFLAAIPSNAIKFDSAVDAQTQIKNDAVLFHGGPEAFEGCTVEETP